MQIILQEKLLRIQSEKNTVLSGRAYTKMQVQIISSVQSEKHSLATNIAYSSGLRAHELLTLQPISERSASTHRQFSQDRFLGRSGKIYTVEGKGGLVREVIIPEKLANQLEQTRISNPTKINDRDIIYSSQYEIGGGQRWSQAFSGASKRNLGWSNGGHGLRHSYAQERMDELQNMGIPYKHSLATISQEMGHFRADITEIYLR